MSQERWTAVDRYINDLFIPPDPALEAALRAAAEAGLPEIQVTPSQGMLLHIMARATGAHDILEIGTLGGYSTIWLARALAPGGRLVTLEVEPRHAAVARANLARAGVAERVEVRLGRAVDSLAQLAAEGRGPFDLVFIDADKPSTSAYFAWAMKLTRPGGLIITDNVVRNGAVIEADSRDSNVQGVRSFNAALAAEPRAVSTIVQTVGSKGYDGFAISVVGG